jgi:hypothetical protein
MSVVSEPVLDQRGSSEEWDRAALEARFGPELVDRLLWFDQRQDARLRRLEEHFMRCLDEVGQFVDTERRDFHARIMALDTRMARIEGRVAVLESITEP